MIYQHIRFLFPGKFKPTFPTMQYHSTRTEWRRKNVAGLSTLYWVVFTGYPLHGFSWLAEYHGGTLWPAWHGWHTGWHLRITWRETPLQPGRTRRKKKKQEMLNQRNELIGIKAAPMNISLMTMVKGALIVTNPQTIINWFCNSLPIYCMVSVSLSLWQLWLSS